MSSFNLNEYHLSTEITDISTAGNAAFVVVPHSGVLTAARSVLSGTITGTAVLTITVDGGASEGTISVAGGEGDVDSNLTLDAAVDVGSFIKVETDGGSTNAEDVGLTLTIRR